MKYLHYYKLFLTILIIVVLTILDKLNLFQEYLLFLNCGRLFFSGVLIFLLLENKIFSKNLLFLSVVILIISCIGNFKIYLFSPGIVMFFLSIEKVLNNKKVNLYLANIGNTTYSMYLLHTPFQMVLVLIFSYLNVQFIYSMKIFLISYLFVIFFISFITFIYFEKPVNFLIRKYYK